MGPEIYVTNYTWTYNSDIAQVVVRKSANPYRGTNIRMNHATYHCAAAGLGELSPSSLVQLTAQAYIE